MNNILFFLVFSALTILYVAIGVTVSSKVKSTSDYFLAGRNLGLFAVSLTLIATMIGGGALVGTSQQAYTYGLYGTLYTLGMAIGFLILGFGFASRLQSLNIATTVELFEKRYGSPTLKMIASALSIITMTGILIAQVVATRSIIEIFNFGYANEIIFVIFWILIIFYTTTGGLQSVVLTDIVQILFVIAIFSGIFLYGMFFGPSFDWGSIFTIQREQFGALPLSADAFIATLFMPALFALIEQDLAQRFFASRTKKVAAYAALITAIVITIFSLIPTYFGMQAKLLGLSTSVAAVKSPLIMVIELLTNNFVVILALCAIIAAIISTASSLLCAVSSNIALDFNFSWFNTQQKTLSRSKIITLVTGLIALGASYLVPQHIIDIIIESYTLSVSCLFVPLVWAYFNEKVSKTAAITSIVFGFITFLIMPFWNTTFPKSVIPLACSLLGYLLGLFMKRSDNSTTPARLH